MTDGLRTVCGSSHLLVRALDKSPNAYVVWNVSGAQTNEECHLIYANEAAYKVYQYDFSHQVGSKMEEVFPDLCDTDVATKIRRCHRLTNQSFEEEILYGDVTSSERWYRVVGCVVDESKVLVNFKDIDLEKRHTKSLEEANKRLRHAYQDLEQFSYAASHDLQEPLRTIISFLGLLQEELPEDLLSDDAREYLDYVIDASTRMRDLVNGLLEYNRVLSSGGQLQAVDLKEVLKDIRKDLRDEGKIVIARDLPTVNAHRSQAYQLLQNLVQNGLKYARPGTESRVRVGLHGVDDKWATIEVADNGVGIQEKDYDKIFLIFRRLYSEQEYSGTGVGLAVCKRIVQRHGGKIWVESSVGQGSTFYFTLPLV